MHFETNYRQVATSSQVQLVCLSTTLVVTSADKCVTPTSTWSDNAPRQRPALCVGAGAAAAGAALLHAVIPPAAQRPRASALPELGGDAARGVAGVRGAAAGQVPARGARVRAAALEGAAGGVDWARGLPQSVVLTQLTTELAKHRISVFQISTYQTDYVLVKVEDLDAAIGCLQSFCSIEMESEEQLSVVGGGDEPEQDAEQKEEPLEVHQHPLSVPDVKLHLVQLNRTFVRRHLYSLVELLFKPTQLEEERFLSYSETGDDISVVTSDENFLDEARTLMEQGDQGVLVSPDFWRPVQIGNTKLGFAETGIVAGQTRVLVNAGTTVFYLSTYATDFMLIKEDEWDDALPILRDHFRLIEGWGALYIFA
ncbi:hypothetical protein PF005_g19155 [Phytophthora fragariae]|uniref:CASTOR ACT domain-containing protein n=1 Tax=Phytophthora fragariae TaxID=53985 RepID=A0A6A3DQY7_9STRA|nr:hypothetical protein PF003_g17388 [Phytophthora fragariae]KAE8923375.1 hypothetical protein PF009_g26376 [Phytophthora fragariae]KAE8975496.1 hypothetical protein PF011_g24441 [Phytophthora fragariae]KAE9073191.1 hypothetical protein PF010_g25175 [Phytophthora fragariae]KAE9090412.1 hypothetical protein PF007_g19247 [Phytophthora fragariae]